MSDRSSMTINVSENTGSALTPVWRLDDDGQPIYLDPPPDDREQRVVPPRGNYRLRFSGITVPFEVPNKFAKDEHDQTKTVVWAEFDIISGRNLTGRYFSNRFTWSLHEKSSLGKFVANLLGEKLPPGNYDVLELLGKEFDATVNTENSDTYAKLVVESVMPDYADVDDSTVPF